ncbi:MAG TPA: hypothetical protein VFR59_03920, partial [Steroidobacteraceae bacterium]|nr:hypothetical protein [Steroidobacteraceae bacterium]
WPDAGGARAKIDEELRELDAEMTPAASAQRREQEIGDLLFSVVNLARHLDVDPEAALRASSERFAARFQAMERAAASQGRQLQELDPAELDVLWNAAKKGTPAP